MIVLADFDHKRHTILLDGEFWRGDATESRGVIDPASRNMLAEIAGTTTAEVDAAVGAAHVAG